MTHHGRHRRRHLGGSLVAAVAVVAVLLGTAWAINSSRDEDAPDRTSRTHVAAIRAALTEATDECRTARDLFTEDIVAMQGAIQQWRLHIDAMTQLVSGKIDLGQAVAFWDSTRIEGKRSLALWERVDGQYRSAQANCATPAGASATATDLEDCRARQLATDTVLRDARDTLADWKMHIRDMEALRAGKLGVKHAVRMWHQMYKRGKVALDRYDADHRQLNRAPECPL